ncbi:Nn.00g065330.m01.CDS01 [Neocucurbitaria sp. VM-36]
MGIPIGWNIRRDEPKEKDVLRADVTGQRSPIRRRVRPNRSPRSQGAFDPLFMVPPSRFAPQLEPVSRPSHTRTRLAPPPVPEVSRTDYRSSEAPRNPPSLQRDESSLRRSRNRLDGYMRAYEARAYIPVDHDRPLPALTPGFAPAAASRTTEAESLRDARELSRIGERSPYRRAGAPRSTRSRSPRADQYAARGDTEAGEDGHETNDNNAVGFPPLRRMGRRTIADGPLPSSSLRESWSPASTLDGLGDRERSISPFDEHLPWDTFLSTVVPDPVGPTTESSFASAAAAASFSNSHPSSRAGSSNSTASSATHLTVPSRRASPPQNEQFMRACDTSEDDTASDTEEEDIDVRGSIRRLNGAEVLRNRMNLSDPPSRHRIRPSYFSNEPPSRDTERYSRRVLERSRDASAYVRSFYNPSTSRGDVGDLQPSGLPPLTALEAQVDGPSSLGDDVVLPPLSSFDSPPLDQELRDARSLLERLSRREDISDDFWASVGLTRSFADPVERFQERERL